MAEDKRSLLQRFILWREKNIKEKRFILILSFLVGIFTAFAALILKVIIHWIQNFLTDNFNATEANYLYLVYPVVGIFLTGLFVRYVVKDDISHGVTRILYAISRRQGRIKRHNTWSSIIASSITIGFGGSVGAEAPIVLTGSAIGSNLGNIFKMEHRTLMLLGGRLVVETVDAILAGTVKSIPQEEMAVVGELRPAPKIFKDTCRIDWNLPVKRIYDFVRGLSPYPAAWTELLQPGGESVVVKIFETEKIGESHQLVPGTLRTDGKTYIRVAAEDGFVGIRSLQLPGKKRLKTDELLRGFRLTEECVMK